MEIILGFALSIMVAVIARSLGALSASGAAAAVFVGGIIFGFGGFEWAVLLLVFFISSSILTRLTSKSKLEAGEKYSKGSTRDWGQVLANGGLGAILVGWYYYCSQIPGDIPLDLSDYVVWIAYAGSLSAVAADTWATELGVFSRNQPRLITSGRPVERGTSGAVSLLGSIAAAMGAFTIGIFASLFDPIDLSIKFDSLVIILCVSIGGLCASFFDSYIGATIQGMFYCSICDKETERFPVHTCNSPTKKIRGFSWMNNDWVNFFASLFGMGVSTELWILYTSIIL